MKNVHNAGNLSSSMQTTKSNTRLFIRADLSAPSSVDAWVLYQPALSRTII